MLIGDKGVGKTFALEVCLWSLCGMSDESKSDPDMDTRTIKASAGMTTNPIPVDDGESLKKVIAFKLQTLLLIYKHLLGGEACYFCI